MRVLGRIRISRLTDESTSAARQREIIEQWADAHDHEIVGWAEDLDVSGSIDPFDTPELGPWLKPERLHEWDILCAWKLDRLARRTVPLHKLFGLCQDNEKTLVCVSDSIDLSHWVGRLVASVIAGVAEGELEAIKERTSASHRKLRELGRWPGGKPSYGFKAVQTADGWKLVLNPETAPVMKQIVDAVLDGKSVESIATRLNEEGIKSPSGKGQWRSQTIRKLLRSKTLLGHVTHDGVTVRDTNGDPILKGPSLIDYETFERLQAALDGRSKKKTRTDKASPLSGLILCMKCDGKLHHRGQKYKDTVYRYYLCTSCKGKHFKADLLEMLFEKTYLRQYGDELRQEHVFISASEHQTALNEAVRAYDELIAVSGTLTSNTLKERSQKQIEALDTRIRELEQLPNEPARWEWRDTDDTCAEAWHASDPDERRVLLQKSGIVGYAGWAGAEGDKLAFVLTRGKQGLALPPASMN